MATLPPLRFSSDFLGHERTKSICSLPSSYDEEKQNRLGEDDSSTQPDLIDPVDAASSPLSRAGSPQDPDGGLTAWLQVVCGFFMFFNSWGLISAYGVFQVYYKDTLIPHSSDSSISWIGSMEAFLLCCTAIFAGPLFDRGYARPMVLTGSFMVVFGFMMTSLGSEYWQLMLSQGICMGIGHGFLFITSIAIVPSYFTTKRSFAIGLAASGSSFGAVIYTVTFHHLTSHHGLSFGWAIRILGFIALATLAIPCVALRPLKPTGPPHRSIVDFSGFRELPFALFSAASFIGTIGIYIPFFYLSLFAASKAGFDADLAFIMLPILSAGSVIGRIAPGFIADFVGPLNVLTLCTMIAGLFGFCWIGVVLGVSLGGLVMWSFLYGIFSGAFVSLQPSIVVSITDDLGMVGGRVGMNTFCAALGSLIGNPIAGFLLAKDPSWTALQAFCGATLFVGSALMVVTRWSRVGLGFAKKA